MRLTEARIKNFKGIEDWTLKFQPGFNLLKGENGTGKTSVLDALALGLGAFVEWAMPYDIPFFNADNIRKQCVRQGDGSVALKYLLPAEITLTAKFHRNQNLLTWTRSQDTVPDWGSYSDRLDSNNEIVTLSKTMLNDIDKQLPVICYQYIPKTRIAQARESTISASKVLTTFMSSQEHSVSVSQEMLKEYYEHHRKSYGRMIGYMGTLSRRSNTSEPLEWCNRMERVRLQKGKEIREYEAVKQAVATFMEAMEPDKRFHVFYDNQLSDLLCEIENIETLPISNYSAGYQSLLWMALDIAWRMAELNPFLLDKITETPGVVLIDELDLHLHPKWQWRVIDALRTTFPNVQFIAATHAPILFASANDVWIVNLEDGKEPSYQWSRYGLDIGTAVTAYQGDYDLPEKVREIANTVSDAINRENYPEAKEKLEELERELAPKPGENGGSAFLGDPPLLTRLRARYDIESTWPEV